MPLFRADIDVKCDSVLPNDSRPLRLTGPAGEFEITLTNADQDKDGFAPGLRAQIVGHADSLDAASETLADILAKQLDMLSFVTHARFEIVQAWRVIEWEPRMQTRNYGITKVFDPRYPPAPDLEQDFLDTVGVIESAKSEGYLLQALRSFRYGLLARELDDQFQRFWSAIEVVAEGRKERDKVPITCPTCGGQLYCGHCMAVPERRPMARQAIRDLVRAIGVPNPEEVYRKFSGVRDGLIHGRTRESIEKGAGQTLTNLVDDMAKLAWHVIMHSMPGKVGETPIHMGHRDGEFAHRRLHAGPIGSFDCKGQDDYPPEDELPTIEISMITSFERPA